MGILIGVMCTATFFLHAATFLTSLVLSNAQCCVALDMCIATFFLHATYLASLVLSNAQCCVVLDICLSTAFARLHVLGAKSTALLEGWRPYTHSSSPRNPQK